MNLLYNKRYNKLSISLHTPTSKYFFNIYATILSQNITFFYKFSIIHNLNTKRRTTHRIVLPNNTYILDSQARACSAPQPATHAACSLAAQEKQMPLRVACFSFAPATSFPFRRLQASEVRAP